MGLTDEIFRPNVTYEPWGPFIKPGTTEQPVTIADIIVASIAWGLTLVLIGLAIYQGWDQFKGARNPVRSAYVWMVWTELAVCFIIGVISYLHVTKVFGTSRVSSFVMILIRY